MILYLRTMTLLTDIQWKLQETHAAIAKLECIIADNPMSRSLSATAISLRKRQAKLESELAAAKESVSD